MRFLSQERTHGKERLRDENLGFTTNEDKVESVVGNGETVLSGVENVTDDITVLEGVSDDLSGNLVELSGNTDEHLTSVEGI